MSKFYLPIAIAVLALSGCAKDAALESKKKIEIVDPNPPVEAPDVISFRAKLPSKFTKTTTMVSTQKTIWNVDDHIWISDGSSSAVYTSKSGGKDSTVLSHVSGDTLKFKKGTEYIAVFPSEIGDFNGVKGEFGLPAYRTWAGFDRFSDVPMVAKKVRSIDDRAQELPQDTLNFKNLCGILKINISEPSAINSSFGYLIIKNMSISADQPLCGRADFLDFDNPSLSLKGDLTPILLNCNGELRVSTSATPVFIYLPEGKYSNLLLEYNASTSSTTPSIIDAARANLFFSRYTDELEIKRGSVTEINVGIQAIPKPVSITQTSNCLVIYKAGSYNFKPTKAESGESVGAIDHAVLLWETLFDGTMPEKNQIITSVRYDAAKDSVNFLISNYPANGGNCLVGVADADNKILWSYHIWLQVPDEGVMGVTSYDTEGRYNILNVSMGATGIMKSNSGGSQNYICQPLLYQWGRKDPFPGQGRNYNVYGRISAAGEAWISASGPASLETSIGNPTTFYSSSGPDWCSDSEAPTWDGPTKSVTDPCPYGYRVMDAAAFDGDYFKSCESKANRGILFMDKALLDAGNTSAVVINYANSSCIKSVDGSFATAGTTYCWTRNASDKTEGSARAFYSANGSAWELQDGVRAAGYPVRCQLIPTSSE